MTGVLKIAVAVVVAGGCIVTTIVVIKAGRRNTAEVGVSGMPATAVKAPVTLRPPAGQSAAGTTNNDHGVGDIGTTSGKGSAAAPLDTRDPMNKSVSTKEARPAQASDAAGNQPKISAQQAIEIAREFIGPTDYDKSGKITTEFRDGQYIVTFPILRHAGPPGGPPVPGPSFAAEVWIDATSGKPLKAVHDAD